MKNNWFNTLVLGFCVSCGSGPLPDISGMVGGSNSGRDPSPADKGLLVVNNVAVTGSTWQASDWSIASGDGRQLQALPFLNVDQIKIYFNLLPDTYPDDAFVIAGANHRNILVQSVQLDPANNILTINLSEPLKNDRYVLTIDSKKVQKQGRDMDGDWQNPDSFESNSAQGYPSGNGASGGDLSFQFNILNGNSKATNNTDNYIVSQEDVSKVNNYYLDTPENYYRLYDINSDGVVNISDVSDIVSASRDQSSI